MQFTFIDVRAVRYYVNECVPGYIVLFLYTLPLKYMFVFDIVFEFHLYSVRIMLPFYFSESDEQNKEILEDV